MSKILLLDVDGVLVIGRPQDGQHWASDIQKDLGIDPDELQRHFFAPYWTGIVTGKMDLRDVLDDCLRRFVPSISTDQLISYWFENDSRIALDVLNQVDQLRGTGVRVFLATNQEHLRARYLLQDLRLAQHVDGIIYSASVMSKKPDQAFFTACEKAVGRAAPDLLLVDDTFANVTAAEKAGWRTVHWTGAERLSDHF